MQADCPKQYLQIQNKTVLEHTIDCFLGSESIAGIIVVVSPDDGWWPELSVRFTGLPVHSTQGGKERADSVLNGLDYLASLSGDNDVVVLVHDAARPCLSSRDLHLLLAAADNHADSGALLATPVRDTMKRSAQSGEAGITVERTENRDNLWHALTPQMADLHILRTALTTMLEQGKVITDEASALEYAGYKPRLLEGDASNIKITRPADLALAEFFLQRRLQEEEE